MTTGRINQVTFLSEGARNPTVGRQPGRHSISQRGRSLLAWFSRQTSDSVTSRLLATGFFGFSETSTTLPIVQSSIAKRVKPRRAAFRRTNVLCKLSEPGQALQWRSDWTWRIYRFVDYMSTHRVIIQTLLSSLLAA